MCKIDVTPSNTYSIINLASPENTPFVPSNVDESALLLRSLTIKKQHNAAHVKVIPLEGILKVAVKC